MNVETIKDGSGSRSVIYLLLKFTSHFLENRANTLRSMF